jgi:hypothetical protein
MPLRNHKCNYVNANATIIFAGIIISYIVLSKDLCNIAVKKRRYVPLVISKGVYYGFSGAQIYRTRLGIYWDLIYRGVKGQGAAMPAITVYL